MTPTEIEAQLDKDLANAKDAFEIDAALNDWLYREAVERQKVCDKSQSGGRDGRGKRQLR